ncbi:bifunctional lytic transglycosylase/C40 family peptidase [Streptomyces sp. NPDC001904]|uniref:C40 family peptidase n=1 Tax=Streptomyces sp. NPDC001904 TaxID=3154531 RepID=UPI003316B28D
MMTPSKRVVKFAVLTGSLVALVACCAAPLSGAAGRLAVLAQLDSGTGSYESGSSADIPPRMLQAYKSAVSQAHRVAPKCHGMRWPILAGIAKVESNHAAGRDIAANGDIRPRIYGVLLNGSGAGGNTTVFNDTDGGRWDGTALGERAVGPFQFMPATWQSTGQDGNGDHQRDPHNADDAALGAVAYLCGRGRDLRKAGQLRAAIFQYNHSSAYVTNVTQWIEQYTAAGASSATGNARTVIEAAMAQRGTPYSWGGGNEHEPTTGSMSPGGHDGSRVRGFDCSGLTVYAFARVGIKLPRTAAAQAGRGQRIPASAGTGALRPGDLVFFGYVPGRDSSIYHVGIYLGSGQMINAPRPGTVVRVDPVDAMSGYAGGARVL